MTNMTPDLDRISTELSRARDEIKLKIHLASKDLQTEWEGVEDRWRRFESAARLEQSAKDVSDAVKILAGELGAAFDSIRKAL